MSDSLRPHGLGPTRLLCSWNSPGKNTGVGCHSLLQGIFLTPGIEPTYPPLEADSLPSKPLLLLLLSRFMSNSVRPQRWQPTRFPHSWDSPDKNTGVGCHFLLQCMKVKIESEVTQPCRTLRDPMDCSPPGSSVYGIFQARVLE